MSILNLVLQDLQKSKRTTEEPKQRIEQALSALRATGQPSVGSPGGNPLEAIGERLYGVPGQQSGDVKAQLRAGFERAGRPDLAGVVDSPDFYEWVNAESGWNSDIWSGRTNQGQPNYGLFQFWAGHPWMGEQGFPEGGGVSHRFSPEQQAYMAASNFPHLTPERIQGYASQIRSGNYPGWG